MADPLSSVGAILGLLSFGLRATASLAQISNSIYLTSPTRRALRKSIGKYAYFVVKLVLADTIDQLERIDQSVLPGSEEVVLAFKNSYISDCTQTAVAVIFSQLLGNFSPETCQHELIYLGCYCCSNCCHCTFSTIPQSNTLDCTGLLHS